MDSRRVASLVVMHANRDDLASIRQVDLNSFRDMVALVFENDRCLCIAFLPLFVVHDRDSICSEGVDGTLGTMACEF